MVSYATIVQTIVTLKEPQKNRSQPTSAKCYTLSQIIFFVTETHEKMPLNPYRHWVLLRSTLYTKCYTGVTFLKRILLKFPVRTCQDTEGKNRCHP